MDAIAQHRQDYSQLRFGIFSSPPLKHILISKIIILLLSLPTSMQQQQSYANYPVIHSHVPVISLNTSNESSAVEELPPKKKKAQRKQGRNHYTKEQKFALETSFSENMYVSIRERDDIASKLNLTPKQVKVWYQNRRQKDKRRIMKEKTDMKVNPGAESPDSGVPEVDEHQVALQRDELIYSGSVVANAVSDSDSVVQKGNQYVEKQYEQPIYSYLSNSSANSAQPQSHYPVEYSHSQAFANYYNNYDYHFPGAYQYLQFMSGYQSHFANSAATSGDAALLMGMHPTTTADESYPGY